jgi:hypothetical protein
VTSIWDTGLTARLDAATRAQSAGQRGELYEDLICEIFETIQGIDLAERNTFSGRRSQEIDIAFWNDQHSTALWFLPNRILVECKNWSQRVGSADVSWFDAKLRRRGPAGRFGILFAASGVTGDPADHTAARDVVDQALAEGREIIIVTNEDLASLAAPADFVRLLKIKLTRLAAGRSF